MQRSFLNPTPRMSRRVAAAVPSLLLGFFVGCGPTTPPPATAAARQPLAGVTLTVACGDPVVARRLADRSAGWAGKTGAVVKVEPRPPAGVANADVVVVRPAELGEWGARGALLPVPTELRAPEHPLQWGRMAVVYRNNLANWGGELLAVPVAGDGYAVVYRVDRFADDANRRGFAAAFGGRALDPPATWEDLADVAKYFADATGKPSLPPLPADPHRLTTQFQQIAACYDRRAQSDVDAKKLGADAADTGTSFLVQAGKWEPRLTAPGFVAAAAWFAQTQKYRSSAPSDDPVAALDGPAAVAVLSLAEVARLPKDGGQVAKRFGVAPLPGTRTYFDADRKSHQTDRNGNYVPFLGSGGWVAAVRKESANAAAAADLIAELAGPAGSLAAVSAPGSGVGPFRSEHVAPERRDVWLGYGFDAEGTKALFEAMKHYLGANVTNPALALRTPDQAAVTAAIDAELRKVAKGELAPDAAMKRAEDAWKRLDADRPPEELIKWRRNAVGLP